MSINTGRKGYIYRYTHTYLAKLNLGNLNSFSKLGSGVVIAATLFMGACTTDGKITIDCTVQNPKTGVNETVKVETTADKQGTACDDARAQVKAAQALPITSTDPTTPTITVPTSTGKTTSAYGSGKKDEMFKSAFVPGKTEVAELIPVVDPQKRQEELNTRLDSTGNVRDPFEAIPGTIRVPNFTEPKARPLREIRKTPPTAIRVTPPIAVAQPVRTDEAAAVLVSGVIEVKGVTYAIVSAPGEPTTRYVSVGSRLSNNQVLVKRIDSSGLGTVVLEQNGVEVPRSVGKAAAVASAPVVAPTNLTAPNSPINAPGTSQLAPAPQTTQPTTQPGVAGTQGQRIVAPGNVPVPGLQIINNTPIQ